MFAVTISSVAGDIAANESSLIFGDSMYSAIFFATIYCIVSIFIVPSGRAHRSYKYVCWLRAYFIDQLSLFLSRLLSGCRSVLHDV